MAFTRSQRSISESMVSSGGDDFPVDPQDVAPIRWPRTPRLEHGEAGKKRSRAESFGGRNYRFRTIYDSDTTYMGARLCRGSLGSCSCYIGSLFRVAWRGRLRGVNAQESAIMVSGEDWLRL